MAKGMFRAGAVGCALALAWGTGCRDSNEGEGSGPVSDVVRAGSDQGSPSKRGYAGESSAWGTVNTTGGLISGNVSGVVPEHMSTKATSGGAGSLGITNEVTPDFVYGVELGRPGYGEPAALGGGGAEGAPPSDTGHMGPARTGGVRGLGGQAGSATGVPAGSESPGGSMLEPEDDGEQVPTDERPVVPRSPR